MQRIDPADGLPLAVVGDWAEDKYLHVEHYARMFARSMEGKWGCRSYLELFAGPGRARIETSGKVIDTAALRALALKPGFDVHGYGELQGDLLAALEQRCQLRQHARCFFVRGDVNETWRALRDRIREAAGDGTYLTFCFVDPYRCADLRFSTVRGLAELYIDFLVLIPSYMDAHRNQGVYLQDTNQIIDRFLGDRSWRETWNTRQDPKAGFGDFVAHQFGLRMRSLDFHYDGVEDMKLMRSTERNLPLYHLAFFSRHQLGLKLWREAVKSSDPQRGLF